MKYSNSLIKFLLVIALAFNACSAVKEDKFSNEFFRYLSTDLKINVDETPHLWILIPTIGCHGCNQSVFNYLNQMPDIKASNQISLIYSNPKTFEDTLSNNIQMIYDKDKTMEKLSLNIATSTIIKTDSGKIKKIVYINPGNLDSLDYFLKIQ